MESGYRSGEEIFVMSFAGMRMCIYAVNIPAIIKTVKIQVLLFSSDNKKEKRMIAERSSIGQFLYSREMPATSPAKERKIFFVYHIIYRATDL